MEKPGWLKVLGRAGVRWYADDAFKHAAAISFYSLFSLGPITLGALTVAGLLFGRDAARGQFHDEMVQLVGPQSAGAIESMALTTAYQHRSAAVTTVGLLVLFFGATSVFIQLQASLNEIWGVVTRPSRNSWALMAAQRLLSFAMVLSVGFLLLISLVLNTALEAVLQRSEVFDAPDWLVRMGNFAVALALITALFALLFKILPDVRQHWPSVWRGAFVTALLFSLGRLLIALYLNHSTVASVFGAAGSLVALLVWIYYSSAILFFGAEFIRAHHDAQGQPVQPKPSAALVRRELVDSGPD
jgi:membrane protein